ncbi:hypothetical protein NRE95_003483 [Salmonella enterica]|nr:hypothetical protein [Salmonella enterica]
MAKREKCPVKKRNWMTADDIQERDYASCKLARQFWTLLYGARMRNGPQVAGDK